MPDFTRPKIRLHTVNIREQFVAPLMNGKLKAITRLNGRGYNAGDCIRFSVLPMQISSTPPIPRVMIPSIRNVMLSPAWTASPR